MWGGVGWRAELESDWHNHGAALADGGEVADGEDGLRSSGRGKQIQIHRPTQDSSGNGRWGVQGARRVAGKAAPGRVGGRHS